MSDLQTLVTCLIERDREALFVLDRSGRVVFSNSAAQLLMDESRVLSLRDGAVVFAPRRLQSALDDACNDLSAPAAIEIQYQRVRYRVAFQRVATSSNAFGLLVVVQQMSGITEFSQLLQQLAGLTFAESEVAAHLCAGDSLSVVAAARSASVNTVKTQTRQVFQKCGVRSRVELVRRLLELVTAQRGMAAAFSVPSSSARKTSSVTTQIR